MKQPNILRNNRGLTMVELMIAIVLLGILTTTFSSLIGFSFRAHHKVDEEYDLQARVRLATETVNTTLRNTSAAFLMNQRLDPSGTFAEGWSYIGLSEDETQVLHVVYDKDTRKHTTQVLLERVTDGSRYTLDFSSETKERLINYMIGIRPATKSEFEVRSTIHLENALAVDYIKDDNNPAQVLAYRMDERPKATDEPQSTVAIALVIDNSGSMKFDPKTGKEPVGSAKSRNAIMQESAKALIDSMPAFVHLNIFYFSENANGAGSTFYQLNSEANKTSVKALIPTSPGGGTNTGDAMRRAYYELEKFDISGLDVMRYVILLTDGNPTFYSYRDGVGEYSSYYSGGSGERYRRTKGSGSWTAINNMNAISDYQTSDGNIQNLGGVGSGDPKKLSLGYAKVIGGLLRTSGYKTFLVDFSGDFDNSISKDIAIASNSGKATTSGEATDPDNVYFKADNAEQLTTAFEQVLASILKDFWHIYGPYGKKG